jgi:hypothetical protein
MNRYCDWRVSDDIADMLRTMSSDTLEKIHDALVSEWHDGYQGPYNERGVIEDDVSWDGPRDDELGDQVQDLIVVNLIMREDL